MVNSVSSVSVYVQSSTSTSSAKGPENGNLSASQIETIENTLANYDASSLSGEDAEAIVEAFSAAGISASGELADVMKENGFDAREVGDLAGVGPQQGKMPPPPPSGEGSEQDSISSILDILLNGEDEDSETITSFETIMDYTSRIISLNEDAKSEVQELLENYAPENTDLARSDANAVIQNTLSQILGNSDNYKTTSFYG